MNIHLDSADIVGALRSSHPDLSEEAHIVTIRWQMVHAHELRHIRESLARLEAALVDAKATGAEKVTHRGPAPLSEAASTPGGTALGTGDRR